MEKVGVGGTNSASCLARAAVPRGVGLCCPLEGSGKAAAASEDVLLAEVEGLEDTGFSTGGKLMELGVSSISESSTLFIVSMDKTKPEAFLLSGTAGFVLAAVDSALWGF